MAKHFSTLNTVFALGAIALAIGVAVPAQAQTASDPQASGHIAKLLNEKNARSAVQAGVSIHCNHFATPEPIDQ